MAQSQYLIAKIEKYSMLEVVKVTNKPRVACANWATNKLMNYTMTPTKAHFPYLNSDGSRSHKPEMVLQTLGLAHGGYYIDLLKQFNPDVKPSILNLFVKSLDPDFEPSGYYEKVIGDTGLYAPFTDFPVFDKVVQIQFAFEYAGLLCFVDKS